MRKKLLFYIFLITLLPVLYIHSESGTDTIVRRLNYASEKEKAELYIKLGNIYEHNNNIDSALFYYFWGLNLSKLTNSKRNEAEALYSIGWNYYLGGNNSESLTYSEKALKIFEKLGDKKGAANSLNTIGIVYQNFGNYEAALESHLRALQYFEDIKDYNGLALTYNHLGVFYKNLRAFSKSQSYYAKALAVLHSNTDNALLAKTYNNMGNLYWNLNELDEALKFELMSLDIKKRINSNGVELVNSYSSIGTVLRSLKQYEPAIDHYKMALKITERMGNKNQKAMILKSMGLTYAMMKMYDKALEYHNKSLKLAEAINYNRIILENLYSLTQIYRNLSQYKLSLKYYREYEQIKDSVFNQELKTRLNEYRNRYDTEKSLKEIQAIKTSRQKSLLVLFISTSALVIFLISVILSRYRTKVSTGTELAQKNKKVSQILGELNILNKGLADSERTYRYLFERNPMPMFILEEGTFNILAANNSAVDAYGYNEPEFLKINFKDLWYVKNQTDAFEIITQLLKNPGKIFSVKHRKKDTGVIYTELVAHPLVYEGKAAVHVMLTDVTERKLIEQIVKESEERFRNLFEGAPDAIIITDPSSGLILDANPAASRLFHRPLNQLTGIDNSLLYSKEKTEYMKKIFMQYSNSDGKLNARPVESEIVRSEGTPIPVEISGRLVFVSGKPIIQGIFRDISIRKKTEQALRQSEQRLRRAQKIANVGNWELDLDSELICGSEESNSIFGFEPDTKCIPADAVKDLIFDEDKPEVERGINDLINRGMEFNNEFRIYKKDSKEKRVLQTKAELIFDEQGRPSKVLGSLIDITELKNFQKELITARERAEKSDKLKTDFLAQMSHEIRSPVNIILSFISLIKEELRFETTEDLTMCFNAIDNGGKRLIRTIELILNMSDVQSGKYEKYFEETDLDKDILRKMINEFKNAAEIKGLNFNYINETNEKSQLIDRYSVTQIVSNLIENAVKYTKEGSIEVRLKNYSGGLELSVKDTGIGISEDYMPHLFDPFSQEEQGYTRRFEGTGLGLALVKKYCDINGAYILVSSKKGEGTLFNVRFPALKPNEVMINYL